MCLYVCVKGLTLLFYIIYVDELKFIRYLVSVQKYIGEAFKRTVVFDLPEMVFKKKAKEVSDDLALLSVSSLFQADNQSDLLQ